MMRRLKGECEIVGLWWNGGGLFGGGEGMG